MTVAIWFYKIRRIRFVPFCFLANEVDTSVDWFGEATWLFCCSLAWDFRQFVTLKYLTWVSTGECRIILLKFKQCRIMVDIMQKTYKKSKTGEGDY